MDKVKVIRILVYSGNRDHVEETLTRSIHGTKAFGSTLKISAMTINEFPEILSNLEKENLSEKDQTK